MEKNESECVKKFTIEGNEHVLTELQILKFLNLRSQVEDKEIDFIKHHIDSLDSINLMKYVEI
jgi:hypothetical protein